MTGLQPQQSLANGRYTVVRPLSQGGMGALFLAIDHEAFERTVVLKTLLAPEPLDSPAEQEAAQQRFLREARTLATLRYSTIPQIYSFFQEGGKTYIAMEFIDGVDLNDGLSGHDAETGRRLPGRPYPRASVLRWGVSLCRTLEYLAAHQPPVVHQDIKPANLILARGSGELFLVDFGAARLRAADAPGGGKTAIFGTPGYAAPEQYQGHSEPRSDVYALASTLYHLVTDDDPGEHPFQFPRLAHLGYLGVILRHALQPEPAARPDATELRVQLEAMQQSAGNRPLRAPDGSVLYDEHELAAWCEANWSDAVAWLYGTLPARAEADWVRPDLARKLGAWSAPYQATPDRGLHHVLTELDPEGYAKAPPEVQANLDELNLGEIVPLQQLGERLRLRNIGRGYVELNVVSPLWLELEPTQIGLGPGQEVGLSFTAAEVVRKFEGQSSTGEIDVRLADRTLLVVPVVGRPPGWERRQTRIRANAKWSRIELILMAAFLIFWLVFQGIAWLSSR